MSTEAHSHLVRNSFGFTGARSRYARTLTPSESSILDRLLFLGFVAYLSTFVIEGPFRYYTAMLGVPSLIYFRDLIAVVSVMLCIVRHVASGGSVLYPPIVCLFMLLLHFLLGILLSGVGVGPAVFGLKIFWMFIYGLSLSEVVSTQFERFAKVLFFFFFVSVFGVIANKLLERFPWEGNVFETAFGAARATREWWAAGERRMPGLARASFDAATIIACSGALLVGWYRSALLKLLVAVLGFGAIYMTTSKGMMVSFMLMVIWLFLMPKAQKRTIGISIVAGLFLIQVLLPFAALALQVSPQAVYSAPGVLSSFADRIANTWPNAFALLDEPQFWLLGRGVGAIGVPQQFSEDYLRFNSGDNMFMYMFVTFGPLAFYYFGLAAITLLRNVCPIRKQGLTLVPFLIVGVGYSLTINMFEESFFTALLGWAIATAWLSRGAKGMSQVNSN